MDGQLVSGYDHCLDSKIHQLPVQWHK